MAPSRLIEALDRSIEPMFSTMAWPSATSRIGAADSVTIEMPVPPRKAGFTADTISSVAAKTRNGPSVCHEADARRRPAAEAGGAAAARAAARSAPAGSSGLAHTILSRMSSTESAMPVLMS